MKNEDDDADNDFDSEIFDGVKPWAFAAAIIICAIGFIVTYLAALP